MTKLAELLAECHSRGIRMLPAGHEGLTIDAPEDALTPELVDRLRLQKADVLASLRSVPATPSIDPSDAAAVWQAALDLLEGDPLFPPDLLNDLREADVRWGSDEWHDEPASTASPEVLGPDDWLPNCIDANDVDPCPKCGSWPPRWDGLGNPRCVRCDPGKAAETRDRAERLRRRYPPSRTRISHGDAAGEQQGKDGSQVTPPNRPTEGG